MRYRLLCCAVLPTIAMLKPAVAAAEDFGGPIEVEEGIKIDPIFAARLRYEGVSQDSQTNDADALTVRMRGGAQIDVNGFFLLAEAEGTLAIADNYNDTIPSNGLEPYPVVADPENVEINRLAVGYAKGGNSVTIGRQRIILDNARFVGNVGWRQNEQTFDAVRGQGKIGPVTVDATYSISQRTIFGADSPNKFFDGDFVLLNGGVKAGPVSVKAFGYLLDYDTRLAFSSQTFGVLASGGVPLGEGFKLDLAASYARQSDYGDNPVGYDADYIAASIGAGVAGFSLGAGYEELGSDDGVAAFQTPLATLHAFNGWADVFLTTPANGLRDYYGSIGKGFGDLGPLKGLNAKVVYHQFDSDVGGFDYGSEWDASLGFKFGKVGLLAKYADYDAASLGTDTTKFWLQAEYAF